MGPPTGTEELPRLRGRDSKPRAVWAGTKPGRSAGTCCSPVSMGRARPGPSPCPVMERTGPWRARLAPHKASSLGRGHLKHLRLWIRRLHSKRMVTGFSLRSYDSRPREKRFSSLTIKKHSFMMTFHFPGSSHCHAEENGAHGRQQTGPPGPECASVRHAAG